MSPPYVSWLVLQKVGVGGQAFVKFLSCCSYLKDKFKHLLVWSYVVFHPSSEFLYLPWLAGRGHIRCLLIWVLFSLLFVVSNTYFLHLFCCFGRSSVSDCSLNKITELLSCLIYFGL